MVESQQIDDSHKSVGNYKVKSDVDKLAATILNVMEVAHSHGVRCWLNYGALLGLVRENRLLPWNNDAHLTCWYDENTTENFRAITDALNKKGYHSFYYSTLGALSAKTKGVDVTINCYWREGEYAVRPHETPSGHEYVPMTARILYWLAVFMGAYPQGLVGNRSLPMSKNEAVKITLISALRILPMKLRKKMFLTSINWSKKRGGQYQKTAIPAEYFNDFVMRDFYGGQVLVPDNPEKLLQFIYGKNWNIPKVDWSFYDEENKTETGIGFIDEMWDYHGMEIV